MIKHIVKKRFKEYRMGDFWAYTLICSCGKSFYFWNEEDCENAYKKHKLDEVGTN